MSANEGYVPTPEPLADYVAASALFRSPDPDARVLYPGAGTGNLLAAVHRRYAVRQLPAPDGVAVERNPDRSDQLRNRISGPTATCNNGVPALSDASQHYHTPVYRRPSASPIGDPTSVSASISIQQADFLSDPPEGPFDYIIANPPYVRYNEIPTQDRDYYRNHFKTASGRFNLYAPFVEQMLELLAPNGTLAFIAPVGYLTNWTAEPLRNRLRYANPYTPELLPEFAFPNHNVVVTLTVVDGPDTEARASRPPSNTRLYLTGVGKEYGVLADRYALDDDVSTLASNARDRVRRYQQRVKYVCSSDSPSSKPAESAPGSQTGLDAWSDHSEPPIN